MEPLLEPLVNGLRLGCLVEVAGPLPDGHEASAGQLGQLVGYDGGAAEGATVLLLDGRSVALDPKFLRAPGGVKKPGQGGGLESFDILLGPRTSDGVLAEEMASCLFEKGFCVLRLCQSLAGAAAAMESVRELGRQGVLGRLPDEVEEGFLGPGGRGKVFWMDRDAAPGDLDEVLQSNDQTFSYLAELLQPFSADAVGKLIDERTPALVSLSLMDEEEDSYPPPMADDRTLGDFLGTWRRGAVRALHVMGPVAAELILECRETPEAAGLPCVNERLELRAAPNTIVLFRPDCFALEVRAEEELLTMMVSFLTQAPQFYLTGVDGDALALRGAAHGPALPHGETTNIVAHHTRLASRWDDANMFFTGLQAGTDAVVEIPIARFDVDEYYCADIDALLGGPPRTVQRHTSYVDGVDMFDFRYFEISRSEATTMDPLQRQVLEVGGNLLHLTGISKQDTARKPRHGGCAVGVDKDDYPTLPGVGGGCNAYAIIANRFSFVFNMKGPNYVCDTACSASLTATHVARMMLADRKWEALEFHLALGTHLCLSPGPWIGTSMSQMVSPQGRCFTFNASANGYLRGEGTSGILMKYGGDSDERDAVLRSSALGQDGKSASLTAPNGPSQEEMIWRAVREAGMSPAETATWECHGTGTSLGDPIEVGAVRRVQIKAVREQPLMLSTAKSNIGHLEGGAAMAGIVRCVREVMHSGSFPSNHVRQLNPHLEGHAFDAFYATEVVGDMHDQGQGQVSSFGFGGSNGHAIIWARKGAVGGDLETQVLSRLARMKPPEVRPIGDDPANWEADLPDAGAKPGDRWTICFAPDDPPDAPIKWVKDYVADIAVEDDSESMFAITGNFNGWTVQNMDAGELAAGQFVATVQVPASGSLEFRFLRDGDPGQVICPTTPRCTRKSAPVYGPGDKMSNSWVVASEPEAVFRIELMAIAGQYAVIWLRA